MSENEYWFKIWALILAFLSTAVICVAVLSYHTDDLIAEAVKRGADPIQASCAIRGMGGESKSVICSNTLKGE